MAVRVDRVAVNVEVNGQKAGTTLKDLEATAKQLRRELRNLPVDTEEFAAKAAELASVNARIREIGDSVRGVDRALKDSTKEVSIWKQALSGAAGVFTGMLSFEAVKAAGQAAISFFKEGFAGVQEAAENTAQLEAVIKSTGGAAGVTREELDEMALAFREDTNIDDEPIRRSMAVLLTFTNVTKENFKAAQGAILDTSVALGQDLQSATVQVGKALNNPVQGISALSKVGVTFTEQQKEMIEKLVETNNVAGAQKIILSELEREFGGVAKAVGQTEGGPWKKFSLMMDDLRDNLSSYILPLWNRFIEFVIELVSKADPVVAVFRSIFNIFGQVWDQVKQLLASFGLFNGKVDAAGGIIKMLTSYLQIATIQIKAVLTVIREFLSALNSLVAGGYGVLSALKVVFASLEELATETFSGLKDMIAGALSLDPAQISKGLEKTKGSFKKFGQEVADAYSKGYNEVRQRQRAVMADQDSKDAVADAALAKKRGQAEAQETEEQRKKREKAEQEALKKRLELQQKLQDINNQVRAAQVEAMVDGQEKDQAREDARYELQVQGIRRQIAELRKLGVSEQEIQAISDKLLEAEHQKHISELEKVDDKYIIQLAEKEKKSQEEKKKLEEQARKEKEDKYKQQADADNEFFQTLLTSNTNYTASLLENANLTEAARQKILSDSKDAQEQIEIMRIESLRQLNEEFGKSTIAQDTELAQKRIDNAQRTAELRVKTEDSLKQSLKDSFQFGIDLLSKDEEARKKNASLIKAFTIASIVIDTEREIAGYMANPGSTASFGIAGALRAALAIARAGLSISKVQSTEFYSGGYTGENAVYTDGNGRKVVGVVHSDEWVAPSWLASHPVYGSVVRELEGVRLRGFSAGGYTSPSMANVSVAAAENPTMERMLAILESWPRVVRGVFTYSELTDIITGAEEVSAASKMR